MRENASAHLRMKVLHCWRPSDHLSTLEPMSIKNLRILPPCYAEVVKFGSFSASTMTSIYTFSSFSPCFQIVRNGVTPSSR